MGIRVRKHLGYGILDLKPDDPRWDIEAPWDREGRLSDFLAWMGEPEAGERILDMAAYEGWGLGRERGQMFTETTEFFLLKEALKDRIEKERGASVSKSFHHDDEFGKGGVVLFQCPQHADWSRHDNIIDYYEEGNSCPRVKMLKNSGISVRVEKLEDGRIGITKTREA